jgi:Catalytic LigB subunit of aromatic ring-opening dioxygenase
MMNSLPAIFLSHGAPDLPIREGAVANFLRSLHQQFPKPKAILVISAHWHSDPPMVSTARQPKTIYDFSGFPEALYHLSYPAPGAPDLGDRVVTLLTQAGITCHTHPSRGLDHGSWTPLIFRLLSYLFSTTVTHSIIGSWDRRWNPCGTRVSLLLAVVALLTISMPLVKLMMHPSHCGYNSLMNGLQKL